MTLPWYYMWSDNYRFFHEIVKDSMKDPEITLKPVEVAQSLFDKELYKVQGKHHWEGSLIKVDLLLDRLNEALTNSETHHFERYSVKRLSASSKNNSLLQKGPQ